MGRILSRFSTDVTCLDQELNFNLYETIESGCVVRKFTTKTNPLEAVIFKIHL